jgi:hypothetical protein
MVPACAGTARCRKPLRAPLDFVRRLDYIDPDGLVEPTARGEVFRPKFFGKVEDDMGLLLHASLLALGCATFFCAILATRCPDCGWHEWVSERFGKDGVD